MKKNTKRLLIKARRNIFGELAGNNISLKSGDGFDFYELRPYSYGEDVRRIDWKRSAKMNEHYVKLFHEEREIQILIVPILTGSLGFGLKRLKQDVVAEIVALLGFSALKNGDRYSIITCKQNQITATKLTKKEAFLYSEVENIMDENLLGLATSYENIKDFIAKRYKKRSLFVFVSDFWEIPSFHLLAKKHEVVAINVRDRFEESPKPLGQIRQIDPNNLTISNIFLDKNAIKNVEKKVVEFNKELNSSFLKQGIRVQKIYTQDNVFGKLSHFLRR